MTTVDERTDAHLELASLILRMMLEDPQLTWNEAAGQVEAALDELRLTHEDGQPLSARDEARALAVADGNTEGFSTDPEPIPDVFREEEKS